MFLLQPQKILGYKSSTLICQNAQFTHYSFSLPVIVLFFLPPPKNTKIKVHKFNPNITPRTSFMCTFLDHPLLQLQNSKYQKNKISHIKVLKNHSQTFFKCSSMHKMFTPKNSPLILFQPLKQHFQSQFQNKFKMYIIQPMSFDKHITCTF